VIRRLPAGHRQQYFCPDVNFSMFHRGEIILTHPNPLCEDLLSRIKSPRCASSGPDDDYPDGIWSREQASARWKPKGTFRLEGPQAPNNSPSPSLRTARLLARIARPSPITNLVSLKET
jgi:hypothetical protein